MADHSPKLERIGVQCSGCNTLFDLPVVQVNAPEPASKGEITVRFAMDPADVAWMLYIDHFLMHD